MKYKVDSVHISILEDETLVEGSADVYHAKFEFDSSWDSYTKIAVFQRGDELREMLIENGECKIPWEVLKKGLGGYLKVGVYGVNNTQRRPTLWALPKPVYPGATPGDESKEPTPDIYQQMLKMLTVGVDDIKGGHRVTFNDTEGEKSFDVMDGKDGAPGKPGKPGDSITIASVTESTESGGENVVMFSDGKKVVVKNGKDGAPFTYADFTAEQLNDIATNIIEPYIDSAEAAQKAAEATAKEVSEQYNALIGGTGILAEDGEISDALKATNYHYDHGNNVCWRDFAYDADGKYLYLRYVYNKATNIRMYADITHGAVSKENVSFDISQEDVYLLFDIDADIPENAGAFLIFYIYSEDYSKGHVINVNITKDTKSLSINLNQLGRDSGWDMSFYKHGLFYGFNSATFASAQNTNHIIVKYYGAYPQSVWKTRNLAEKVSFLMAKDSDIENQVELVCDEMANLKKETKPIASIGNASITRNILPSYYFDTTDEDTYDVNEYLPSLVDKIPNGYSFAFITDQHWTKNQKNSIPVLQYVVDKIGIDRLIVGGDIVDLDTTKYKAIATARDCINKMRDVFSDKVYVTVGNHDQNTPNMSNQTEEYILEHSIPYSILSSVFNGFADVCRYDASEKINRLNATDEQKSELKAFFETCYYFDDEANSTRFISVNTGTPALVGNPVHEVLNISGSQCVALQLEWLYDVLMNTPNNYNVVVFGHAFISQDGSALFTSTPVAGLMGMLSAMYTKQARYTVNLGNSWSDNKKLWFYNDTSTTNINIYFDFGKAPNLSKILVLCGDSHKDRTFKFKGSNYNNSFTLGDYTSALNYADGEIPLLSTTCDAHDSGIGQQYTERIENSITEQAFDVVTFRENAIDFIRFGVGDSRRVLIN